MVNKAEATDKRYLDLEPISWSELERLAGSDYVRNIQEILSDPNYSYEKYLSKEWGSLKAK